MFSLWIQMDMAQPAIHKRSTSRKHPLISCHSIYWFYSTKVLRLLNCLQVACFTDRTFHNHQSEFLKSAVISVWKHRQLQLLAECASRDSPLTIGGDGRADSPGHSVKYGSYGIIDLSTNKILHIELVQVNCICSYT